MKKLLSCLFLLGALFTAAAHDHIEIGRDPGMPSRLAFNGNTSQLATYFPPGEPTPLAPGFPGGAYATELTFAVLGSTLALPNPSQVWAEVRAVAGPAGGTFSFWEADAVFPTFTRTVGSTTVDSFPVSEFSNGEGHLHGRVFTFNKTGVYDVTFRAVDQRVPALFTPSNLFVVRFTVVDPPQLAISKQGASIKLTFTSRANFVYDVQSSTTLAADDWTTIGDPLDGYGGALEFTDPIDGRPRVFYRLVEYQ